jgi:FKBP-type peptidyl-prolyl cis-trans isomerase
MNRLRTSTIFLTLFFAIMMGSCDSSDPFDPYRTVPEPFDIAGKQKVTLPNGLIYYVVQPGEGEDIVTLRSTVDMFYTGRLTSNRIFDSSYIYGSIVPRKMYLPDNIRGFNYGAVGMKQGEKRKLIIPPALGYGENPGAQYSKDTLVFDIELEFIYPQKIAN